jgi:hypothetical protein
MKVDVTKFPPDWSGNFLGKASDSYNFSAGFQASPSRKLLRETWMIVSLLAVLGLSLGAGDAAWARGGWGCINAT